MEIEVHISSSEENSSCFLTICNIEESEKEVMITINSSEGGIKSIFISEEDLKRAVKIFTEKTT